MKIFAILLVILQLVGCSHKNQLTKDQAIEIARAYIYKESPSLDISQMPPTAMLFKASLADGGSIWTVEFAYPSPIAPKTGKVLGVRSLTGLTVWVRLNGSIKGMWSHSP
jgi:hypothetical protein